MLLFLANDGCSKSRNASEWLEEKGIVDVERREYLSNPLTRDELNQLLEALGTQAVDLVRSKETENIQEIVEIILKDPSQMQRPILWNLATRKAAIGRPLENFEHVI